MITCGGRQHIRPLGRKFLAASRHQLNYTAGKSTAQEDSDSGNHHSQNEYQFLQESKLPMRHFQASLPRLAIPQLDKTCERYLRALKPLLTDTAFSETERKVAKFQSEYGKDLQQLLIAKDNANKHTSYISGPWFEMYLKDRSPLPINYNPVLIMKHDSRHEYNAQLTRSANLIISALRFYRSLKTEYLAPEVFHLNPKKSDTDLFRKITGLSPKSIATYVAYAFKAFPLDMSQYENLFGTTRIPEIDEDRIHHTDNSKHILVLRNGNFYRVEVLSKEGYIESPNVILGRLQRVFQDNRAVPEFPVSVLTAAERNQWASLRHHLIDIGNKDAVHSIDTALFCVCLDDSAAYDEANPKPVLKDFLAGDGVNRWFDKSFSIFVGKDGTAGINFEHSWGDGVAVLRFFNEIYTDTTQRPYVHPNSIPYSSPDNAVQDLTFKLDDKLKSGIKEAKRLHQAKIDSLDINFLKTEGLSRDYCKRHSVSPDSIMQLAFQLGFKLQYDQYVSTYESCSTAAFRHGRTECIRSCTLGTKEFCDAAVLQRSASSALNSELKALIQKCSTVHGQLTKEAAMGQGFDRHLFGLKHIGEVNGLKNLEVFADPSYALTNYNILSTSTLASPGIIGGGFGPVVRDGFGIGYTITNHQTGAVVSSYKGQRDGVEFVNCLKEAFNIITNVLEKRA